VIPFVLLAVAGAVLVVLGLVGCVLPVLPGPPIGFLGIVLLWAGRGWEAESFGPVTVAVLGVSAAVVTVLDYVAPAVGAKRYGASKRGVWGSVIGMLVGMFFLPPFGMLIGAYAGALVGERTAGKRSEEAFRAAWGVFVGTVVGILLKLVVSVTIAVYFVIELFS